MSKIPDLKPGEKLQPMPQLDPEHGFDAVRRIVNLEGPPPPPPPPEPLRTRSLRTIREVRGRAEADPDGKVTVGEVLHILELLVDRVF